MLGTSGNRDIIFTKADMAGVVVIVELDDFITKANQKLYPEFQKTNQEKQEK